MTATILLALAVFGACTVESVEALTIVLAASTRGMKPALQGAGLALVILLIAGGTVGLPLVHYVPLRALQAALGAGLLYLGGTWVRKAVLRSSGRKAKHDEPAIFAENAKRRDVSPFRLAFGGVMVEGFEVLLIVLTLGPAQHRLGVAALAAGAAVVLVAAAGFAVAKPLARVHENTMKLAVSVILLSMGSFLFGEGAGLAWPGKDLMILALLAAFATASAFAVRLLSRSTMTS